MCDNDRRDIVRIDDIFANVGVGFIEEMIRENRLQ